MFKKVLSIITTVGLTASLLTLGMSANAEEIFETVNENGFIYEINEDNSSVSLIGYIGESKDVVTPTEINGLPVTEIGSSTFAECVIHILDEESISKPVGNTRDLNSVTISDAQYDSVNFDCASINEIVLPNTQPESIGFLSVRSLKSLTIPNGYTKTPSIICCNDLEEVIIPNTVTTISYHSFHNCESLKELTIPSSVTSIVENAIMPANEDFIIKGYANSPIHSYAHNNKIRFKCLDVYFGDSNADSFINMADVLVTRKALAKWNVEIDSANADVNNDNTINMADVLLLRKYLAKHNVTLG